MYIDAIYMLYNIYFGNKFPEIKMIFKSAEIKIGAKKEERRREIEGTQHRYNITKGCY